MTGMKSRTGFDISDSLSIFENRKKIKQESKIGFETSRASRSSIGEIGNLFLKNPEEGNALRAPCCIKKANRTFNLIMESGYTFVPIFRAVPKIEVESVFSLVMTKLPWRTWNTTGRLLGSLAYLGSLVTYHLIKSKGEEKSFRKLQLYELELLNPEKKESSEEKKDRS